MSRRRPGEYVPGQEPDGLLSLSNREAEMAYLARRRGRPPAVSALPAADASRRADVIVVLGGSGVADSLYVCLKAAAGTYSWKLIATG